MVYRECLSAVKHHGERLIESAHMNHVIPSGSEADKDTGENQMFLQSLSNSNDTAGEKAPNNTRC